MRAQRSWTVNLQTGGRGREGAGLSPCSHPPKLPPSQSQHGPLRPGNQWQPGVSRVGGVSAVATPALGAGLPQLEGAGLPATPGAGVPRTASPPPSAPIPPKGGTPPHPRPCAPPSHSHPSSSPALFQPPPIAVLLPIPSLSRLHPHPISCRPPPPPSPLPAPLTGAAQPLFAQPDQQRLAHVAVGGTVEVFQAPHVLPIILHVLTGWRTGGSGQPRGGPSTAHPPHSPPPGPAAPAGGCWLHRHAATPPTTPRHCHHSRSPASSPAGSGGDVGLRGSGGGTRWGGMRGHSPASAL